MFASNRQSVLLCRNQTILDSFNQIVSDSLRELVTRDYAVFQADGRKLTSDHVFRRDVGAAVNLLQIPKYLWAGAGFGQRYGFNTASLLSPDANRRKLEIQAYWLVVSNAFTELAGVGMAKYLLGVHFVERGSFARPTQRASWQTYLCGSPPVFA